MSAEQIQHPSRACRTERHPETTGGSPALVMPQASQRLSCTYSPLAETGTSSPFTSELHSWAGMSDNSVFHQPDRGRNSPSGLAPKSRQRNQLPWRDFPVQSSHKGSGDSRHKTKTSSKGTELCTVPRGRGGAGLHYRPHHSLIRTHPGLQILQKPNNKHCSTATSDSSDSVTSALSSNSLPVKGEHAPLCMQAPTQHKTPHSIANVNYSQEIMVFSHGSFKGYRILCHSSLQLLPSHLTSSQIACSSQQCSLLPFHASLATLLLHPNFGEGQQD